MPNRSLILLMAIMPLSLAACTGIYVKKNPSDHDKGIRYYRPKPYLVLAPVAEGAANGQNVSISLQYLPDFSEEYSIHLRTGINGTVSADIKLDQGWNLTGLNASLDPNTDDLIDSVANLVDKIPSAPSASSKGRFIVKSSNVPLGYYEAVVDYDCDGRKQLYGWRYVGFLPYRRCPLRAGGQDSFCCDDVADDIYGLAWKNGTLTFKKIGCLKPTAENKRSEMEWEKAE